MTTTQLDTWFNTLDSNELAFIFPKEFEHNMMSADPDEDINDFNDEAESLWKKMSTEEKLNIYNNFNS